MLTLSSLLRRPQPVSQWRSLCHLSGAPEAAHLSARCRFSLSTVEVMCNAAVMFCALVEQEHSNTWRWAVYGTGDTACTEGSAPTLAGARRAAIRALVRLDQAGMIQLHLRLPVAPLLHADAMNQGGLQLC